MGFFNRIDDQLFDGHIVIPHSVDEGRVGSVFEQSAHEIGKQGFMRAHRRIDAARTIEPTCTNHIFIQRLAHAVQALKFIVAMGKFLARQLIDCGHCLRVMRGELRKDMLTLSEQFARASDIANIGMNLAGEHRKVFQAINLSALDLGIPIGALDQPDHDPMARPLRQIDNPVDDRR